MHILIICTGNLCRSQLAAGYLNYLVQQYQLQDVQVEAAGIKTLKFIKVPEGVKKVAHQYGFQLGKEFGRQVNVPMIDRADIVLVMEYHHASSILELCPDCIAKIHMLGKYGSENALSRAIKDPKTFKFKDCNKTFSKIKLCIDIFFQQEILTRIA